MQVWLPAALKANTGEAGADVQTSGFIQVLATWEMGTLVSKRISTSQCRQRVCKEGEGRGEQRDQGERLWTRRQCPCWP